ncbi:PLP-dependent aminotransferase family protein [Nitratireductor sp. ZSWI3]|uniref:MocR-like pyridoxine biosynthesis transcription factor PdxR n=1 Tax=Nitratireductor sp. ZSWI3 TaxID=2966359 RepID=UPI00214FFCAB|nr:PLP-dependent aminotransferase family protein [Nitratireductor sp. ZSWI3]MCR4265804.1 PLP-dependent aminotransferase family protein [Nitratireductor sp. ZSWI3]
MKKSGTSQNDYEAVLATIVLEDAGDAPKYLQLYRQLRDLISNNALQAGMRLPSTRALAADFGIARNTVVQVYEQLETEGYIETAHGKLARVANLPTLRQKDKVAGLPDMAGFVSHRGRQLIELDHRSGEAEHHRFQPGMPDIGEFPFSIWRRLVTRHLKPGKRDLFGYYSYSGHAPLREAIASYVETSRGVKCSAQQVMITSGAQSAMNLLAILLTNPGDTVLMEEPGYTGVQGAILAARAKLEPLHVDEHGWRIPQVGEASPRLIYVTPSCQFPMGATMRMEQRLQLLDYAQEVGAWVIEDDFDSEYRFCSQPIPAMQGADRNGRTIYVGTFSKTLFPSLRIGFIVFPGEVGADLAKAGFLLGNTPPLFLQAALADFITEGHFAKHLRRMKRIYDGRRSQFMKLAGPMLEEWLEPLDSGSGLQTVWKFRPVIEDIVVTAACERVGLNVTPLSVHYRHGAGMSGLILGYALMSDSQMGASLGLLQKSIRAILSSTGKSPIHLGSDF